MDLKAHQPAAFAFLESWVESNEAVACVEGYAGVGKTALIGHWVAVVKERHPSWEIVVAAPTNKALDVLRSKITAPVEFRTVDSYLGFRIKRDEDGEIQRSQGKGAEVPDLIVVDEASMIKGEYNTALLRKCKRLLYVGDPAQLPPINEDISPAFKVARKFTMTEVIRFDGALIKIATMLRERIKARQSFVLPDVLAIPELGDRQVSKVTIAGLYNWSESAIAKGLEARILAFDNMSVARHNSVMHQRLYPNAPLFGEGEIVLVNEAYELKGEDADDEGDMLYNGELLKVVACEQADSVADVVIYNVTLDRKGAQLVLQVAYDEQHMIAVRKDLTEKIFALRRQLNATSSYDAQVDIKAQIKQLVDLRRPLNALAPLRHSYSSTVHKSQGSTYDVALVDWASIYRSQDRARLMYVAVTRPSKWLALGV
jgi:exodeoxyribonuclease-5